MSVNITKFLKYSFLSHFCKLFNNIYGAPKLTLFVALLATFHLNVQASLVGSIPGELTIDKGAASYSVPISVPPGINGFEPSLSFHYRSGGYADTMGEGWALTGVSSIYRCAARKLEDGYEDGINFTTTDRFCLGGQKLVAVSGAYGENGTEYRTQIDNFSRIVSYQNAGTGPAYFKVWTKSGKVVEYGNTTSSSIKAQGKSEVLTWAINKETDSSGNEINYSYNNIAADSDYTIANISYANGNVQIDFNYQTITTNPAVSWLQGSKRVSNQQLQSVTTSVNNNEVNRWQLNYRNKEGDVRLLTDIELCAQGECLPTTEFDWQTFGATSQYSSASKWINDYGYKSGGWRGDTHPRELADVNGDGRPDIVAFSNSAVQVSLATGSTFSARTTWLANKFGQAQGWRVADHLRTLADVNGDGLDDIVGFANDGVYVATSTGSSFNPATKWINNFGKSQGWDIKKDIRSIVDINNDGLNDILAFNSAGVWVSLSTGTGFASPGSVKLADFLSSNTNWKKRTFADVNGDGRLDIIGFYTNAVYVALGSETGFAAKQSWGNQFTLNNGGWNTDNHPRMLRDVNQDGLADIVGFANSGVNVALSTGTGFAAAKQWVSGYGYSSGWRTDKHNRMLVDANGDGILDIVGFNDSGVYASFGDGKQFTASKKLTSSFGGDSINWYLRSLGDVNGDGLLDVIGFDTNGVNVATMPKSSNADRGRSVIHQITNGLGAISKVHYGQMSDTSLYQKGSAAAYPYRDIVRASYLVKSIQRSNGIGSYFTTNYNYGEAITHINGRGNQGFKWIKATNQQTGIVTHQNYYQAYPYTGMMKQQKVTLSNGTLISDSQNNYTQKDLNSGSSSFIYRTNNITKKYELDGSLISTTTTENLSYDDFGNVLQKKQTIDGAGKSFSQTDNNLYNQLINDQYWYTDLLTSTTQTKSHSDSLTPDLTNTINYEYFPNSNRLKQRVIEPNTPLAVTTTYTLDSQGNVTSVANAGHTQQVDLNGGTVNVQATAQSRTITTNYTAGQFPSAITNALGHVQHAQYEPNYGNVIEQQTPNGLYTFWQYDALGRKTQETRADNTETQHVRRWSSQCSDAPYLAATCITTTSSGDTPVTLYYDQLNREVRSASTGFDGRTVYVDNVYDKQGRLAKTSRAYFKGDRTYWAEFKYDAIGRMLSNSQPGPNGHTSLTKTQFNGLEIKITDAKGNIKTTQNNVLGNIEHLQDPLGASIQYAYDARGNLIQTVDDQGNTITLSYDNLNNKIAMDDPDKGQWSYQYNAFGELITQTDAKNQNTYINYDLLGRMVNRFEVAPSTANHYQKNIWQYDTATNGIGLLASEHGPNNFSKIYQYDELSRPIVATTHLQEKNNNQHTLKLRNQYDQYSRLQKQFRPGINNSEFEVENIYNDHGYLSAVRSPKALIGDYSVSHLTDIITNAADEAEDILNKAQDVQEKVDIYFKKANYYRNVSLAVTPVSANNFPAPLTDNFGYRLYTDSNGNKYIKHKALYDPSAKWLVLAGDITVITPIEDPDASEFQHQVVDHIIRVYQKSDGSWALNLEGNSATGTHLVSRLSATTERIYLGDFDNNNNQDLVIVKDGHPAGQHLIDAAAQVLEDRADFLKNKREALLALNSKKLNAASLNIKNGEHRVFTSKTTNKRYLQAVDKNRSSNQFIIISGDINIPIELPVIEFFALNEANGQYTLNLVTDSVANDTFAHDLKVTGKVAYIGDNNKDSVRDLVIATPPNGTQIQDTDPLGFAFFDQLATQADDVEAIAVFLQKQANSYIDLAYNITILAETSYRQAVALNLWVDTQTGEYAQDLQNLQSDLDYLTFWRAKKRDAEGRLTRSIAGSGLTTNKNYDPATGQLLSIQSGFFYSDKIRNLDYQYDVLNSLTRRADLVQGIQESFHYDALDRLVQATVASTLYEDVPYNHSQTYNYDTLGNIVHKSSLGSMEYGGGNAGPHAVTSVNNGAQLGYDANGNMTQGRGRTLTWTADNKPSVITRDGKLVAFTYGVNRSRYLKTTAATSTIYLDKIYERVTDANTQTTSHKNMIYADGQLVAINVDTEKAEGTGEPTVEHTTRYMHYDPLGSIDTITGPKGEVVDRLSFDPFGGRRPGSWKIDLHANLEVFTNRGFTGHEHVAEVGLIHMNGRVYDAELGRFLAGDRYIQAPTNTQSFNRYSYVMNNPLKYTDPSGWLSYDNISFNYNGSGYDPNPNGDNDNSSFDFDNANVTKGSYNQDRRYKESQRRYKERQAEKQRAKEKADKDAIGKGGGAVIGGYNSIRLGAPPPNRPLDRDTFFGLAVLGLTIAHFTPAAPLALAVDYVALANDSPISLFGGGKGVVTKKTVGRWMSPNELAKMQKTGKVQESYSGTTHVADPANPEAFIKQTKVKNVYVEFDVPASSLKKTNEGWAQIVGPNSATGRLAARKGNPVPEMPDAENITHKATKIR